MVRAIRGATTVKNNTREEILDATSELVQEIMERNGITRENIISIIFSVTSDLDAAFPATAARQMGFDRVAMLSTYEMDVPDSLRKCIRVLMHIQTDKKNDELAYVYLKEARKLRPDIIQQNEQMEE
ncbi:MAG: chorismate mutase [Clostridiaceae bacterium]|jgi:chorismate mutase|nr:chorismate mutase [Bacillota bacterium]NLP07015.1 chorismate mutase [Clostridiaceae bacterium]HQD31045.1 chorismate mutase [Clostridiales bacterium]